MHIPATLSGVLALRSPTRWSLRAQMLVLTVILLIPMVLVAYLLVQDRAADSQQRVLDQSMSSAEAVNLAVDYYVGDVEKLLRFLAEVPAVKAKDSAATDKLLASMMSMYPNLTNLFAADDDGFIFAGTVFDPGDPWNISDRQYFRDVISTGVPVVSGRVATYWRGVPCVMVVVPLRGYGGAPIGVIGASLSLADLQRKVSDIGAREGARITILDSDGVVVLGPGRDEDQPIDISNHPPVEASLGGESGLMEYTDPIDGQQWLAAYAPAEVVKWHVVVESPLSVAHAASNRMLTVWLVYLLLAVLTACLAAVVLTAMFLRPLHGLVRSVRTLPVWQRGPELRGDSQSNEVESLATAFGALSSNLSATLHELTRAREEVDSKAAELRRLLDQTAHLQEDERRRVALDLHDGAAQYLAAALYEVENCKSCLSSDLDSAGQRLERMGVLLGNGVHELKRVVFDLRPTEIDDKDLVAAVEEYVEAYRLSYGFDWCVSVFGDPCRLDCRSELAIFRIVQEALHNVRKHAKATSAQVLIEFSPGGVKVVVQDNGKGFDSTAPSPAKSLGLKGMQDRAKSIDARLEIESSPGCGTRVTLRVETQRLLAVLGGTGTECS